MRVAAAFAFATVALVAAPARADDGDARAVTAFAVGAVAAAGPLAIGGVRAARGKDNAQKDVGWVVAATGLTLAPLCAHAAVGDSAQRTLAFTALPALGTATIATVVAVNPDAIYRGNTGSRTTFTLGFGAASVGAVVGVLDAMHPILGPRVAIGPGPGHGVAARVAF